jgi:hypothetical protein
VGTGAGIHHTGGPTALTALAATDHRGTSYHAATIPTGRRSTALL